MRSPLPLKDFYRTSDQLRDRTIVDAYAIRLPRSREYEAADLLLDNGQCRIAVDPNTDEIVVSIHSRRVPSRVVRAGRARLDHDCLAHLVGKKLGWSWTCYNSQGYRDAILLSVSGVVPDVIFYAIASSLRIRKVSLKSNKRKAAG
jgi:hypothetical protein